MINTMTITMMSRMISVIRSSPNQEEKKESSEDTPPEPDCCCTMVTGVGDGVGVEVGGDGVFTGGTVGSWTFILSTPPLVAFAVVLRLGVTWAAAGMATSASCTLMITIIAHMTAVRVLSISDHQLGSTGT